MLDPGVCAGLRGGLAAQQVSSRGLVPRLSIGTLQLSIRCSSVHFLPKRSFPVSTVEIRLVSGPLAVCDCSCAMAGDSAVITSEIVTPSTRLREDGRMETPSLEADRAGWLKKLRRTLRLLLPTQRSHRALFRAATPNSFDVKHIELAF